jgi:hypothetical protein
MYRNFSRQFRAFLRRGRNVHRTMDVAPDNEFASREIALDAINRNYCSSCIPPPHPVDSWWGNSCRNWKSRRARRVRSQPSNGMISSCIILWWSLERSSFSHRSIDTYLSYSEVTSLSKNGSSRVCRANLAGRFPAMTCRYITLAYSLRRAANKVHVAAVLTHIALKVA